MRRFPRFSYTLFQFAGIALFRHTSASTTNQNNLQLESMLASANAKSKDNDFMVAAEIYDQIRALPDFTPEKYYSHLFDMFRTYAIADPEKLRCLFLSDRHRDYYQNYVSDTRNTALHYAMRNGLTDVAKHLAKPENILLLNDSGMSPIHLAFHHNDWEFIEFAIQKFGSAIKKIPFDENMDEILAHGWCYHYPAIMTHFEGIRASLNHFFDMDAFDEEHGITHNNNRNTLK